MSLYRRRRWRWVDKVLLLYAFVMGLGIVACIGLMFGMLLVRAGIAG